MTTVVIDRDRTVKDARGNVRPARVSIGLPVYNGEKYLRLAVDSILSQTFPDFELILCDNASTDGTASICREYVAQDPRVRYVRHPTNIGVSRNFNAVLDYAQAPLFKWASCDDVIERDLLEKCIDVLDRHPDVVLVHTRARPIGADGEHLVDAGGARVHVMHEDPSERLSYLLRHLTYCNAQYGVMRTDVLRRTALFGSYLGSDVCFLSELCLHGKFFEVSDSLLKRRFHGNASSSYTAEQLLSHYGLGRPGIALYNWRHFGENLRASARAPLSTRNRIRIVHLLLRRAIWLRAALAIELKTLLLYLVGLVPHAYLPASKGAGQPTPLAVTSPAEGHSGDPARAHRR